MTNTEIILKALDEVEELRQKLAEGPLDDYDLRRLAADVASLFEDPELHNRATWIDLLKADPNSKYYQRYNNGPFHI